MVASFVLVGEQKPNEVRVTFVLTAKSLEHLDLSLVFCAIFSMKCFDGKVLFFCPLLLQSDVSSFKISHR